jgi:hypothetical protein
MEDVIAINNVLSVSETRCLEPLNHLWNRCI